jgi:hypothetical protein
MGICNGLVICWAFSKECGIFVPEDEMMHICCKGCMIGSTRHPRGFFFGPKL